MHVSAGARVDSWQQHFSNDDIPLNGAGHLSSSGQTTLKYHVPNLAEFTRVHPFYSVCWIASTTRCMSSLLWPHNCCCDFKCRHKECRQSPQLWLTRELMSPTVQLLSVAMLLVV